MGKKKAGKTASSDNAQPDITATADPLPSAADPEQGPDEPQPAAVDPSSMQHRSIRPFLESVRPFWSETDFDGFRGPGRNSGTDVDWNAVAAEVAEWAGQSDVPSQAGLLRLGGPDILCIFVGPPREYRHFGDPTSDDDRVHVQGQLWDKGFRVLGEAGEECGEDEWLFPIVFIVERRPHDTVDRSVEVLRRIVTDLVRCGC